MTALSATIAPHVPAGATQVDLWGNDSPKPSDGHTAPPTKAQLRRAATAARRQRKITRRLYLPVTDLEYERLAAEAATRGLPVLDAALASFRRGLTS